MIRILRRIFVSLILSMLMLAGMSIVASAAVEELSIRVNNIGAQVFAQITGAPDTWVSVELLYPDADIADVYNSGKKTDVLAGVDMLKLNESGSAVYKYTADERTGIYTLRASGDIEKVEYTASGNEPADVSRDVLFAEMWTSGYENVYTDHVQGAVWLRANMLNNMESTAKRIKSIMDTRAPGRRMLFIDTSISDMFINKSEKYIWEWEEVEAQAELLEKFFDIYYHIGGEIDAIYTDCEQVMSTWELQRLVNEAGAAAGDDSALKEELKAEKLQEVLDGILSDPAYAEKIEPELIKRGFYFHENDELHKLYQAYTSYYGYKAEYGNEHSGYLVWCAVMDNYKSECLKAAIYEPAAKFFPNISYCNYSSSERLAPLYSSSHKYYLAGNRISAGTHSSPVLYKSDSTGTTYYPDGTSYPGDENTTPFTETRGLINSMRSVMLSTGEGRTMPWVTAKHANTAFRSMGSDIDYYYEYLIHVAMCNPDALLFYGPYYDTTTTSEEVEDNIDGLYKVMEELNTYFNKENSKTLIGDLSPSNQSYILSGIYTNDKNLWRISFDHTALEDGEEFNVEGGEVPAFYISGARIEFPQGVIRENIHSKYGYWVETPEDVYPVITYDNPPESCNVSLKIYDESGIPLEEDAKVSEIGAVAFFYEGLLQYASIDGKTIKFAEYDDNQLLGIGPLKNSIWGGTDGRLVFSNFDGSGQSKIFIWESLDGLKPLTPALPWDGR